MRFFELYQPTLLCLLLAAACGDEGAAAPTDPDDFVPTFSRELCNLTMRCGAEYPDLDTCIERVSARYEDGELGYILDAVADGRTTYVKSGAQACLDLLHETDCRDVLDGRNACSEVFVGTQEAGSECMVREECAPGAYCELDASCPGTCEKEAQLGDNCADTECPRELTCYDEICDSRLRAGEACSIASRDCELGLRCVDASGHVLSDVAEGTCGVPTTAERSKLGDACSWSAGGMACDLDLACVPSADLAEWTCVRRIAGGMPCRAGMPNACVAGFYCTGTFDDSDGNGTCEELPGEGEACTGRSDFPCSPDLECFSDGKCHAPRRIGGACEDLTQCASRNCQGGECVSSVECGPDDLP